MLSKPMMCSLVRAAYRWSALGLLVGISVAGATGCGDAASEARPVAKLWNLPGGDRELVARVSAGTRANPGGGDQIFYVNIDGARRQLSLPRSASAYGTARMAARSQQFASVSRTALLFANTTRPGALVEAIDGGRIHSAVARQLSGFGAVMVIRTRQPFAEISSFLRQHGYRPSGSLLVAERPVSPPSYPIAADAGRGVVVLAGDKATALAALAGQHARLTPAGMMLAATSGVARIGTADRQACILRSAFGYRLAPAKGRYVLVVQGNATAARMTIAGHAAPGGELTFGKATAEGPRVQANFKSHSADESPWSVFFSDPRGDYEC